MGHTVSRSCDVYGDHLFDVPNEIFFFICDFLSQYDLLKLAQISSKSNVRVNQYLTAKITPRKREAWTQFVGTPIRRTSNELQLKSFDEKWRLNKEICLFLAVVSVLEKGEVWRIAFSCDEAENWSQGHIIWDLSSGRNVLFVDVTKYLKLHCTFKVGYIIDIWPLLCYDYVSVG